MDTQSGFFGALTFLLIRFSPRRLLSRCFGRVAAIRFPSFLFQAFLRWYCRTYNVEVEAAAQELSSYRSLSDFFIRDLKPGLRPIGNGIVSPVDGRITEIGGIQAGQILTAKGRPFSLEHFLGDGEVSRQFQGGTYVTLYLAPGDYHHIHSPVTGDVRQVLHIPGDLWPVHDRSVRCIDRLFCRNERVSCLIESASGLIAVVMVGALNVGSIRCRFGNFQTNLGGIRKPTVWHASKAEPIQVGERLATFCLGSTVLLIFQADRFRPNERCVPGSIRYGESIANG